MSQVAVAGEGSPTPMRSFSTPLPSRDFIVSQQVQTLLGAANTFMAFIANSRFQAGQEPDSGPLDGGVKAATEVSLMNICDRLDTILKDDSRWGMEQLNRLEVQLSKLYASHISALVEQRKAVAMTAAPQSRLSPQLRRMPDGVWVAFIGNPQSNDSVIGVGTCVQEALDDFDKLIEGKQNKHEQTKQPDSMDTGGNRTPQKTVDEQQRLGVRNNPRKKLSISGKKTRLPASDGKAPKTGAPGSEAP